MRPFRSRGALACYYGMILAIVMARQSASTPTPVPTLLPTLQPTGLPSFAPTLQPSPQPTSMPTLQPTALPTLEPSSDPTMGPSSVPTISDMPSVVPTLVPSASPTLAPTAQPTLGPSSSPSSLPSLAPSHLPTIVPTPAPSRPPTLEPTHMPTMMPSSLPSRSPSLVPSHRPTLAPTDLPTLDPTLVPSAIPSLEPSAQPTLGPSLAPTHAPSLSPTALPSLAPTLEPTPIPTLNPTQQPTFAPYELAYLSSTVRLNGLRATKFSASMETAFKRSLASSLSSIIDDVSQVQSVSARSASDAAASRRLAASSPSSTEAEAEAEAEAAEATTTTMTTTTTRRQLLEHSPELVVGNRKDMRGVQRHLTLDAINITAPSYYGTRNVTHYHLGTNITIAWRTVDGSRASCDDTTDIYVYQYDMTAKAQVGGGALIASDVDVSANEPISRYVWKSTSSQVSPGLYYQIYIACSLSKYDYSDPFYIWSTPTPSFTPTPVPTQTPQPSMVPTPAPTIPVATDVSFTLAIRLAGFRDRTQRRLGDYNGTTVALATTYDTLVGSTWFGQNITRNLATEAQTFNVSNYLSSTLTSEVSAPTTVTSVVVEYTRPPTLVPTLVPTPVPTLVPSPVPTLGPTLMPSSSPTLLPTFAPTSVPSLAPSRMPVSNPTIEPTPVPTKPYPTPLPSLGPTGLPTLMPSLNPSPNPTNTPYPSNMPSGMPSASPTLGPSKTPTLVPSLQPSPIPTMEPTGNPTSAPSLQPSPIPVIEPTGLPTISPSRAPTSLPTLIPTAKPTLMPTSMPTILPTPTPSLAPSLMPVSQPTIIPTPMPTVKTTWHMVASSNIRLRMPIARLDQFTATQERAFKVALVNSTALITSMKDVSKVTYTDTFNRRRLTETVASAWRRLQHPLLPDRGERRLAIDIEIDFTIDVKLSDHGWYLGNPISVDDFAVSLLDQFTTTLIADFGVHQNGEYTGNCKFCNVFKRATGGQSIIVLRHELLTMADSLVTYWSSDSAALDPTPQPSPVPSTMFDRDYDGDGKGTTELVFLIIGSVIGGVIVCVVCLRGGPKIIEFINELRGKKKWAPRVRPVMDLEIRSGSSGVSPILNVKSSFDLHIERTRRNYDEKSPGKYETKKQKIARLMMENEHDDIHSSQYWD